MVLRVQVGTVLDICLDFLSKPELSLNRTGNDEGYRGLHNYLYYFWGFHFINIV